MIKSYITYLVISDIHLGHPRTPTEYIINNLYALFKDNHILFKKLDIIFIAGDVMDRLLASNSKEFIAANEWLCSLAIYCSKHNIKLRILEGTPSHDWKQLATFSSSLEKLNIGVDYSYIQDLSIERMEDLGIDILYVPDEVNEEASVTLEQTKALLNKHGLDKVDIAIMHGQFNFQLPMIKLPSSHSEEDYLNLVRYYINIGHIHTSNVYSRILGQGSFDRLSHNEEEDKGCMVMTIYHTGDMEFLFIKNKNAYPYKKFDVSELETSKVVKYLSSEFKKLKLGTRVKIIVNNTEVNKLLQPLQERFKDLIISVDKKKQKEIRVIKENKVVIKPFEINKDNIVELLFKELEADNLTKEDMDVINSELQPLI